jgi:hypothetical protein
MSKKESQEVNTSKDERDLIEAEILAYLELKNQEKELKKDIEDLKANITAYADSHIADFDDKGVLKMDQGVIKIAQNPPKCISILTEKPLTPAEREEIAQLLNAKYQVMDINSKEILKMQGNDKVLDQVLKTQKVEIVQETRYDVKEK